MRIQNESDISSFMYPPKKGYRFKKIKVHPVCFYCETDKDVTEKRTELIPYKNAPRGYINTTVWCCKHCYFKFLERERKNNEKQRT